MTTSSEIKRHSDVQSWAVGTDNGKVSDINYNQLQIHLTNKANTRQQIRVMHKFVNF